MTLLDILPEITRRLNSLKRLYFDAPYIMGGIYGRQRRIFDFDRNPQPQIQAKREAMRPRIGNLGYPVLLRRPQSPLLVKTRRVADGRISDILSVPEEAPTPRNSDTANSGNSGNSESALITTTFLNFPNSTRQISDRMGISRRHMKARSGPLADTRRFGNGGFRTNYKLGRNPHAPC